MNKQVGGHDHSAAAKAIREAVDARDELATFRAERAEEQERYARALAELRLASNDNVDYVTDQIYEDAYKVLDRLKDRCWNEGYLEGIRACRIELDKLSARESESSL